MSQNAELDLVMPEEEADTVWDRASFVLLTSYRAIIGVVLWMVAIFIGLRLPSYLPAIWDGSPESTYKIVGDLAGLYLAFQIVSTLVGRGIDWSLVIWETLLTRRPEGKAS